MISSQVFEFANTDCDKTRLVAIDVCKSNAVALLQIANGNSPGKESRGGKKEHPVGLHRVQMYTIIGGYVSDSVLAEASSKRSSWDHYRTVTEQSRYLSRIIYYMFLEW